MLAVVVLGGALIIVSRGEPAEASAPFLGDHWHAAYGISVCGTYLPFLADDGPDTSGIHTHNDGLIHIHPFSTRYTGDGANLGAFAEQVGIVLQDDLIALPGSPELRSGGDCGGEPAVVQVKVWDGIDDSDGRRLESNVADYAPADGDLIAIAFGPEGSDIPKPPSAGTVPSDVPGAAPVGGVPDPDAGTTRTTLDP